MSAPRVKGGAANGTSATRVEGDFYRTPAPFTRALLSNVDFGPKVWEPMAGDGSMSNVLSSAGYDVYSSDIRPRARGVERRDFLTVRADRSSYDIITNPAFSLLLPVALHGLIVARRKLALVFPIYGLGGLDRYEALFGPHRPALVLMNPRRLWINGEASQFQHTWVVWDHKHRGATELRWLNPAVDGREDER